MVLRAPRRGVHYDGREYGSDETRLIRMVIPTDRTMTLSGRKKQLSIDSALLWLAENDCKDIVFDMPMLVEHPSVKMVAHMFGCEAFAIAAGVTTSWAWPESRKRKAREIRAKGTHEVPQGDSRPHG
jgi:hypothetical protein